MTTSNGAPVEYSDISTLNERLIYNNYFMDSLTHFDRERIPERVVHAKGAGAFGYLVVTNDVTNYTKADFLSEVGKKTPVAVRFSLAGGERGSSDSTASGLRGFAVKFYTKEGNFDILGLNTPVFAIKDPVLFPDLIRALGRNPATNVPDSTTTWDFFTRYPETLNMFIRLFGNDGTPRGYRYMPGYGIHTYQIQNKYGDIYFVRYHFTPEHGKDSLTTDEASELGASDPDSFTRDLYEAVACGKRVSWKFGVQHLTPDQAFNSKIDVFDPTLELPFAEFPITPVGKLVLNKNPVNYFAEIEQLAFCPCNLVPGIDGAPDKLFEGRLFSYRDTQHYRLGVNSKKIKVNCPFETLARTYNRDGVAPVGDNGKNSPNYYENSFNGPVAYNDVNRSKLIKIKEGRANNFEQTAKVYLDMDDDEKSRVISNIVNGLGPAIDSLHDKAVNIFTDIEPDLGNRIRKGLEEFNRQSVCTMTLDKPPR
ncbi:catalase-like [Zerene cesonia]|uniref:catalase-like n=1 Tax=Zerene cesonia TaxID=33412 RepID=UPI0018E58506|nr:catalase-like [Zerene cesonia]